MFDKENFIEYIRENFSYNNNYISLLSNVIDYGIKNLDYSKNQLAYFIREMMDYDIEIDEILQFEKGKSIDEKDFYMDQLKKSIIDYINREFQEDNSYEDFDKLYPDKKHIGLAFTETPDGIHGIQSEINLEEKSWTQYVDDVAISTDFFVHEGITEVQAIKDMTQFMKILSFENFVHIEEEDLKQALGLEIDDDGNFYDPSEDKEKEVQYYSKDDPTNLMTNEMLERVPELYAQEDIPLADQEVHAAYIIPFRSNWTWYMTEYEKETGTAFGLVLGFEPEWGYFNLQELKEVNAQRLILKDFPKTFRQLKDTELAKQMTEQELKTVFNGELSFKEEHKKDRGRSR